MAFPRIPYTTPFPPPIIHPRSATTLSAAIHALQQFLTHHSRTLVLTGAGISVASGLADYRGEEGTYRLNQQYRPIFFHEFTARHESRQRYWARSFLGWPVADRVRPNTAHAAVRELWRLGAVRGVVTQNVDSLHGHGEGMEVVELHGALRDVVCLSCHHKMQRGKLQRLLAALNPQWKELQQRAEGGVRMNPDGDVDVAGADYTRFRYPPCPRCVEKVAVDSDGAYLRGEGVAGVLKPCFTFFGESVAAEAKTRAEEMMRESAAVLVVGSSLATYSAWRLVRDAGRAGKGLGVVNIGGVRGEAEFFGDGARGERVRVEFGAGEMLRGVVGELGGRTEELGTEGLDVKAGLWIGG